MNTNVKIREILKKITKNNDPDIWEKTFEFSPDYLDSLDMATLALSLEEEFSIQIPDDNLIDMRNIENIENFINQVKK